ncbi:vWA domain-containing protein [Microbaculum marinum]|uniref:VWA domain-containing protein n=1 Tax=Microbaculum marinum TaxID=1764581 RepID=A0AAW9RQ24_9HYPH
MTPLPRAARPLAGFCAFLRNFGFAVSADQIATFLAATTLLGPRSMDDIRRAGHAVLAPPPERIDEFDALFRAWFHGEVEAMPAGDDAGEETVAKDDRGDRFQPPEASELNESGEASTRDEVLASRSFEAPDDLHLRRFRREAPRALPRRRSFRRQASTSGRWIDMRRTMRAAVRNEGDVAAFARARHKRRQRNILILIDVSGSMKTHTEDYLRLAHAVTRAADRVETFTFGTRLTRISRAMRLKDRERALFEASRVVEDWDGGTRIGEALNAFLAIPRFAGYARGSLVIVLSDGLERGGHDEMVDAVRRLARRAWKMAWLTPLAADPRFRPETAGLKAILPLIDELGDGGSVAAICDVILSASRDEGSGGNARERAAG